MIDKIVDKNKDTVISSSPKIAAGFFSRFLGLMFRRKMNQEEALVFYRAPSIHTFFMFFPIDIVFLGRQMKVKRLVKSLRPWRAVICKGAYATLELPAGRIDQTNISVGDQIEIREG